MPRTTKQSKSTPKPKRAKKSPSYQRAVELRDRMESLALFSGSKWTVPQLVNALAYIGKRDVAKFVSCTERQLAQYVTSQTSVSSLPQPTRDAIDKINAVKMPKHIWTRKSAALLLVLMRDAKRTQRKTSAAETQQS